MIRSMTGFARVEAQTGSGRLSWELRAVNHRYLDLSLKLPEEFRAIENELRALPDIYYVLAWNFKQEILANNRALLDRGIEFYFPVDPGE